MKLKAIILKFFLFIFLNQVCYSDGFNLYSLIDKDTVTEKKGYTGTLEVGFNNIVSENGSSHFKANYINGFKIDNTASIGLGLGVRVLPGRLKTVFVPVYFDLRFDLTRTKNNPYISFGGGYSFNATHDFREVGLIIMASVGMKFEITENVKLLFGVGYELQKKSFPPNLESISIHSGFTF